MFKVNDTITAVEIGTASIKVIMGKPTNEGALTAIGYDETSSMNKVVKGEVTNVPAMIDLLSDVFNNIESITGTRITDVYLAVTGNHIHSTNVIGSVPITSSNRLITSADIVEATRNARAFNLPIEQKGIHTFQRTYLIDDNQRASNPESMVGNKLTADIHVIYGNYNKIQTICSLVDEVLGRPANDIAFSAIADYYGASMTGDRSRGLLVIDVGAGVTEYAVFYKNGCMHSGQIAVGCEHIANDISIGLHMPIAKCRELVKSGAHFHAGKDEPDQKIKVELSLGQPPRIISRNTLKTIIDLRLTELFELIQAELKQTFLDDNLNMTKLLGGGIILCGGGALIGGVEAIVRTTFNVPVKIGYPANISGIDRDINNPRFVTPVGLLQLGHQLRQMDIETPPSFKKAAEHEMFRVFDLCRRAFRF